MSEESLGDELKDKAAEVAEDVKEGAQKAADAAKEAASDIKEGWNKATNSGENKKLMAGLLGILIGSLGIHKFVLGYTKEGIIQIVISAVTCGIGGIVGFIEGIIYLTKSDEEFYETYQKNKRPWF